MSERRTDGGSESISANRSERGDFSASAQETFYRLGHWFAQFSDRIGYVWVKLSFAFILF